MLDFHDQYGCILGMPALPQSYELSEVRMTRVNDEEVVAMHPMEVPLILSNGQWHKLAGGNA